MCAGFDEALRKREHEFRVHADEMNSTVLAHELKVMISLAMLSNDHRGTIARPHLTNFCKFLLCVV